MQRRGALLLLEFGTSDVGKASRQLEQIGGYGWRGPCQVWDLLGDAGRGDLVLRGGPSVLPRVHPQVPYNKQEVPELPRRHGHHQVRPNNAST